MSNPIPPLANATLVFATAGGYAVDSMTGNYVQIDQDATYYATLKQSRDPSYDQRIGVDESAIYMKGASSVHLRFRECLLAVLLKQQLKPRRDVLNYSLPLR